MEESGEIKRAFAQRRGRRFLLSLVIVILVVSFVLLGRGRDSLWAIPTPVLAAYGVVFLAAVFFAFRNWRCPACGRFLGRGLRSPKFCRNCGAALQ